MTIVSVLLDLVLIGLLIAGIFYAVKLTRQLADMKASRADMERFVGEFNATVMRAEAGIRGLKNASRESGDDLERLIERGQNLRDELNFLTESADQIANRLSESASIAARATSAAPEPTKQAETPKGKAQQPAPKPTPQPSSTESDYVPASAAERELMRVLKKIG